LTEVEINRQRRAEGLTVSDARERKLASEAAYFNTLALQYNIADRQTRTREAEVLMLGTLLSHVLRHEDVNLPEKKIRTIMRLLPEKALEIQEEADYLARHPES
jgi:hypothetical protein